MARTAEEIKKEMTDSFLADETLKTAYGIAENKPWGALFSRVSIENILVGLFAATMSLFEKLFDKHTKEVSDIISKRAHTLTWYRNKALAFRYGYSLADDVAEYADDLSDVELEEALIVKKCSCQSAEASYPTILVKVAKDNDPLTEAELAQFSAYMTEVADAGVRVITRSLPPDKIALQLKVWYDPLVCDKDGYLYIGSNGQTVAEKAVEEYLKNLAFNGAFYPKMLEQYLMQQNAIKMAKVEKAIGQPQTEGEAETIGDQYIPYAGAMVYDKVAVGYTTEYINFEDTYRNA